MENLKQNLLLMLGMCLALTFTTGCGDDDDDDNDDDESPVVGVWNGTLFDRSGCDDPEDDGAVTLEPGEAVFTFGADGNYTFVFVEESGTDTEIGTYTVSGNTISICENGGTDCDDVNFTITGNTLEVNGEDDENGCSFTATFTSA